MTLRFDVKWFICIHLDFYYYVVFGSIYATDTSHNVVLQYCFWMLVSSWRHFLVFLVEGVQGDFNLPTSYTVWCLSMMIDVGGWASNIYRVTHLFVHKWSGDLIVSTTHVGTQFWTNLDYPPLDSLLKIFLLFHPYLGALLFIPWEG